jgi:hypothetical protein
VNAGGAAHLSNPHEARFNLFAVGLFGAREKFRVFINEASESRQLEASPHLIV